MTRAIRTSALLFALLGVSGCEWTGRQADSLGGYLPVIGERCEHWQCVTSEGQAKSEQIRLEKEAQAQKTALPTSDGQPVEAPLQPPPPPVANTPFDTYTPDPLSY